MSTKNKIIIAAIDLFNASGTSSISTNHIAEQAGISPGNLYYHFKDKAHIIRAIFEQMVMDWEPSYEQAEGQMPSIDMLQLFIAHNFRLLWKYRFFSREQVALLQADAALRERHIEMARQRFARQRQLLQQMVDEGVLHLPQPTPCLDDLLTIAWIIANHYLNHLETMGQSVDDGDFLTGAELVMTVFQPYLISNEHEKE